MFRWIEHTGELELEIETASAEAVFGEALEALAELLGDGEEEPLRSRELTVTADDAPGLLAAWLEELAFLAETEGFVPAAVERLELDEGSLRAVIRGRRGDPPHLVKAVTYHRLELARNGGSWRARAVLDV